MIKTDLQQIKEMVESFTEVDDISKQKQTFEYFIARAIYYDIALKKTKHSLFTIGNFVGKDHASVLNAMKKLPQYFRRSPRHKKLHKHLEKLDIDLDLCTDLSDKKRIVELEKKLYSQSKKVEEKNKITAPETHVPLVELVNKIPEHHVELVRMRLDAIVRMLPKTPERNG